MPHYPLITYISIFSVIIPLIAGFSKITLLRRGMKILLLYLIWSFFADIYLLWLPMGYFFTLGLSHVYYIIEFIFIMSIMYNWQDSNEKKILFLELMVLYSAFWAVAMFTFEPLTGLYTFKASISQIILTICAEYTLYVMIKNTTDSILTDFRFWVLLAFVIYYAGTLILIIAKDILLRYPIDILFLATTIDWSLKILFNVLFAIGFKCRQTRTL